MATDLENRLAVQAARGGQMANRDGETIFDLIEKQKPAFAIALRGLIKPEVFVRIATTTLRTNPNLVKCDPKSLLAALMLSAQLGLEPGGPLGRAYLVPYGREVTFIVGYKGYMELARRSGRVSDIYAEVVREGDRFEVAYGLHRDIIHVPGETRGKMTHVYAVATYLDGSAPSFVVLDRTRVESFRKRSKASSNGPWVTDEEAMWLKTGVRRLATWLPLSIEMAQAAAADEHLIVDSSSLQIIDQEALSEAQEPENEKEQARTEPAPDEGQTKLPVEDRP